ncbi:MAG: hypothetical protein E7648_03975 [Ruminococcaceae bacterium]|nr:hypothetical protein [Oscillospiraceae bacterium]
MEFKKKLKIRLWVAISYIVLGIAMATVSIVSKTENQFTSSFGLALTVMGIARVRNYFLITKNEDTLRKREITETDERNVSIVNKARSTAFTVYILLAGIFVIVMGFLDKIEISIWVSYSVALLVFVYWICYIIYQKKS